MRLYYCKNIGLNILLAKAPPKALLKGISKKVKKKKKKKT